MAEFLLELFSEEIPARMQARAAADLDRLVREGLGEAGLEPGRTEAHATPRRLALVVEGLPAATPDVVEERKGPKADAPRKAIDGFLRATGLTLDQCEKRDTGKGEVWFAVLNKPGRPTPAVLAEIVGKVLTGLPWPKSMVTGEGRFRWVRPLHHVLAVFDGAPLTGTVEPEPHTRFVFTGETRGHRFLAPDSFAVDGFAAYRDGLRAARVILDREERKRLIEAEAKRLAGEAGLILRDDPGLVDEVAGLVEWPVAHLGRIDDAFMVVPEEVLIASMRGHQRYFACLDAEGRLAPRFVVVANTETADGGAAVVAGNERVLRARLADARFFWDQDRKTPLADRVPALGEVVFHARLGTMADKVERMAALAADLSGFLPGADRDRVRSAATLAKADLVTGMVGEFPELQGVMGRYYALEEGEDADVAEALALHYAPVGPTDACPSAPTAVCVALADKIDTLVGFFAIDEKPTGSRDPYALRRAALGVIRLVLENGLRLPLGRAFATAAGLYGDRLDESMKAAAQAALPGFFADRLKVALRERGVRHDLIDAVFGLTGEDDLVRLMARVDALAAFVAGEDGANLLTAYRRAANIVRIESKRDGVDHAERAVDGSLLAEPAEIALAARLGDAREVLSNQLATEAFGPAMQTLAALRPAVDAFFDEVTVNTDAADRRANRLALLASIGATMNGVADFSRVEG
ncbi:MAG: glycine--tRNA ligase subunit beta [Azospirillaceae bacterium]